MKHTTKQMKYTDKPTRLGLQILYIYIYMNQFTMGIMIHQPWYHNPQIQQPEPQVMAAGGNDLFASTSHGSRTSLWS